MVSQVGVERKKPNKLTEKLLSLGRLMSHAARKDADIVDAWKNELRAKGLNPSDELLKLMKKEVRAPLVLNTKGDEKAEAVESMSQAGAIIQMSNAVSEMASSMTQQMLTNEKRHIEELRAVTEYMKNMKLEEGKTINDVVKEDQQRRKKTKE